MVNLILVTVADPGLPISNTIKDATDVRCPDLFKVFFELYPIDLCHSSN